MYTPSHRSRAPASQTEHRGLGEDAEGLRLPRDLRWGERGAGRWKERGLRERKCLFQRIRLGMGSWNGQACSVPTSRVAWGSCQLSHGF